ncbi:MAG: DUF1570 domain-containing protein [Planctomycetes bacterium]|nr:DUF1570 domain-containing protein [Planctomycetota bacterium]
MKSMPRFLLAVCLLCCPVPAFALDHISLKRNGKIIYLSGKIVIEADDGGVLLLATDGVMWPVPSEELQSSKRDARPFKMLDKAAMAKRLVAELQGFRVHKTAHYVVCYNTSPAYAQWCGALYERLYRGFFTFWKNQGLKLTEPDYPMIALVFNSQLTYAEYAKPELGATTNSVIGYFSTVSNRVVMYDLTRFVGGQPRTAVHINRILSQPRSERNVATIVHEATHQLVYNSGLHQRFADVPRWLSEGMAIYFETPDLNSKKGWSGIGEINRVRLTAFRNYLRNRPADSLTTLLTTDERFKDAEQMAVAYGEAWSLHYFLIRNRPKEYLSYLKILAAKEPYVFDTPEERLAEFKSIFGDDLKGLDAEFVRAIRRIRP